MMAAEGHEIVEAGFAASGPVFDVVCVYPFALAATGEAAALVANSERMADGSWYDP